MKVWARKVLCIKIKIIYVWYHEGKAIKISYNEDKNDENVV